MKQCKHVTVSSGDLVPMGNDIVATAEYYECDNPQVPDEFFEDDTNWCDENCPYYKAGDIDA